MTKRAMWVGNCLLWAAIWFAMGLFFFPFWVFTFVSLMMLLLPVGVPEARPHTTKHDPGKWGNV